MNSKILVLLINLKKRNDRLCRMQERLKSVDFQRIEAIDGKEEALHLGKIESPLTNNEKACISSHIKALRFFLESDYEYCTILEDDIILSERFFSLIKSEIQLPKNAIVIKLETMMHKVMLKESKYKLNNFSLDKLCSIHNGTAAYLTTKHGAQIIVEQFLKYDNPADVILFGHMLKSIKNKQIYQLNPACGIQEFIYDQSNDSDIASSRKERNLKNKEKIFTKKLTRELLRPFKYLTYRIVNINKIYNIIPFK